MNIKDRSVTTGEMTGSNKGLNLHGEGYGKPSQVPVVPNAKETEVSEVVGDGEKCGAVTTEHGGEAGPGSVKDRTMKAAGVTSHPNLMRAHQMGSVSHHDHKAVHGEVDKCVPMQKPVTYEGGKSRPSGTRD